MNGKTAVLLLAYGGPDSLEDIEPYLLDVRGGRPTAPELVAEVRERYARIGGRSPLLEITRAQAQRLEARLAAVHAGRPTRVYVGMRHWTPYIAETVRQIAADGFERVVALCMAPHASRYSTSAYRKKLDAAVEELGRPLEVIFIESWHDQPGFIQAIAENIRSALERFPADARASVHHLFSAHSLPAAILEQGDPYPAQLAETARLVAERLGLPPAQWSQCYQSAGAIPGKWLGPQVDEILPELAERGVSDVLITAIGFVADHVEVLYDLDVEAREQAEALGLRFQRTASPNTSPAFIDALAQVVEDKLRDR